ncbi:hypothetical protein J1605_002932 [Eschrichtius robustus]|uniref:Uncharacterized protein n=1 Tax=Eschrichtius robustus TaxID=9764 RepID=A0AB34HUN2_ESCRO|nr:hypothetical protein J1605_002932 [Eschrichtius robustus]
MEIVAHGYLGSGEAQHSVDKLVNMTCKRGPGTQLAIRAWLLQQGRGDALNTHGECREKISELNIVENLLMILHEYDLLSKRLTAELLRLLCAERQVREQVKLYEGVPILLSLLHSDHLQLLWSVVWILVQVCEDPETSVEIRIWGGIKQILHILRGDRNFVSDHSSIGSLSSANAAGRIQQFHLSGDLSPREIQENTFSLQAACCAALTELVLDDTNAHQVVQHGPQSVAFHLYKGKPVKWILMDEMVPVRLFPTDLFEIFIDIGHYVRDISAYEELVSKLNLLVVRKRTGQNLLAMKEVNLHNPAFGKDKKDRDSSVRNIVSELTIIKEQLPRHIYIRWCTRRFGFRHRIPLTLHWGKLSDEPLEAAREAERCDLWWGSTSCYKSTGGV